MKLKCCAICGESDGIEQHHWLPKSMGGSDDETNLLTLCPKHHGEIHSMRRRCNISKIVKERLAAAKARGVKLGSHGKVQATRNKNKADKFARKMKSIFKELKEAGFTSRLSMAKELNKRGIKPPRGGVWYSQTVRNYLERIKKI